MFIEMFIEIFIKKYYLHLNVHLNFYLKDHLNVDLNVHLSVNLNIHLNVHQIVHQTGHQMLIKMFIYMLVEIFKQNKCSIWMAVFTTFLVGLVGGWLENWRVMIISALHQVIVEVETELGNIQSDICLSTGQFCLMVAL